MNPTDDRRERAPKKPADGDPPTKAVSGRAPVKAASVRTPAKAAGDLVSKKSSSARAPKKSPTARVPKKPVNDRSLERELQDRAAKQALAGRSLESLLDEFVPRNRSLDNIDAIVSPRITDPTVNLVKGATVRKCAQCSEDVWVAPSSFAAFKGRKMPPIWCAECAILVADLEAARTGRRPLGRA